MRLGQNYPQKCTFQRYGRCGQHFSITGDTLTIMGSKGREQGIPKSSVEGFNGSEVFLNLSFRELRDYEVKA